MKASKVQNATGVLASILLAGSLSAQQEKAARSEPDLRTAPSPPATATNDASSAPSERERQLIERIDKLERRMAELEAEKAARISPGGFTPAKVTTLSSPPAEPIPVAQPSQASAPPEPQSPLAQSASHPEKPAKPEPFAFADFTWLTGNSRAKESPLETKAFTGEVRLDIDYIYDFNHPKDHTIGGSSEIFRSGEVQVTQVGVGGDFHWKNVLGRVMTQFGMYSQTTP